MVVENLWKLLFHAGPACRDSGIVRNVGKTNKIRKSQDESQSLNSTLGHIYIFLPSNLIWNCDRGCLNSPFLPVNPHYAVNPIMVGIWDVRILAGEGVYFVTKKFHVTLLKAKNRMIKAFIPLLNDTDMYEAFCWLCVIIQWMNGLSPTWYDKYAIFAQVIIYLG